MADDNGPMTFDALTEVYRVERNSPTLSPIRKDFYAAAQELIEEKSKECDRLLKENPFSVMYDGAVERKKNAINTLKKIVGMRMEKIASMATRGAMGANNVIDNLTSEEKEYYSKVLESSKVFWTLSEVRKKTIVTQDITEITAPAVTGAAVKGQMSVDTPVVSEPAKVTPAPEKGRPVLEDVPLSEIPMDDSPEEMAPQNEEIVEEEAEEIPPVLEEKSAEIPPAVEEEPAEEPLPETVAEETPAAIPDVPEEGVVVIRILEDLPPFSGPEYNYVLKKEDIVRMPVMMANALINRGKARIVPTA